MSVKEVRVAEIGRELFARMQSNKPGLFDTGRWSGQVLEWAMRDPEFKTEMFRFVDVFPVLQTPDAVSQHIREYLLRPGLQVPGAIKLALKGSQLSGLTARLAASQIAKNMTRMAGRFIAGADAPDALPTLRKLWDSGQAFTVDKLGEATVSESEADAYAASYLDLLDGLVAGTRAWPKSPRLESAGAQVVPRVNLSVKASAMCSQFHPLAFDRAVDVAAGRLTPIFRRARETGAFVNMDMEQRGSKDLVLSLFQRVMDHPDLIGFDDAGVVIQAYLRDAESDLDALIAWAKQTGKRVTVRLVKGAYWDYETVQARQQGWPSPVWRDKADTDACFERLTLTLMKNSRHVRTAIGSHNLRSVAFALAAAEDLRVGDDEFEFQALYGMAEPIRSALVDAGYRVRVYSPVGAMIPGMAYLVRRLLENTSNESWLRMGFVEGRSVDELLAPPKPVDREPRFRPLAEHASTSANVGVFSNEPVHDFGVPIVRAQFARAVSTGPHGVVRSIIDGAEVASDDRFDRVSPSDGKTILSSVELASTADLTRAIDGARRGFETWSKTASNTRSDVIFALAHAMRLQRDALSAIICHESGKPWAEADGDVCEAIDFCEYYGRQMLELAKPSITQKVPGEQCELSYVPRGVTAVIAPWNFPLAIAAGMTTAALVAGNTVILKPAEQSSIIARRFTQLAHQAGVPAEALQLVIGEGEVVGRALVRHPDVATVAFTGSMAVGLDIWAAAAITTPEQPQLRRVVCEMGGKNPIIIDDDADLDEAVLGVVHSAFAFAGQKCSACSRVIVLDSIYDAFTTRLVEAARSLIVGPATEPDTFVGPVIDRSSFDRIVDVIAGAQGRLTTLLASPAPAGGGYVVGPTIFGDVPPDDPLAQNEVFGPVLAVLRASDFDHAIDLAHQSRFALTAGVFSRSPVHIALAKERLQFGNIYINRSITGAVVERHPFGGFKMSGGGTKAGGADYLKNFMNMRVISESTMRRGFTPDLES